MVMINDKTIMGNIAMGNTALPLLFLITYLLLGCTQNNLPKEDAEDLYNYPVQYIQIKGEVDWINQVELKKYKRNGEFDTLVSTQKFKFEGYTYNPKTNRTLALFPEIDYHYDFTLEFKGDSLSSLHRFSNVEIKTFKTNRYTYKKIVKYKYNSEWYNDGECAFEINIENADQ